MNNCTSASADVNRAVFVYLTGCHFQSNIRFYHKFVVFCYIIHIFDRVPSPWSISISLVERLS